MRRKRIFFFFFLKERFINGTPFPDNKCKGAHFCGEYIRFFFFFAGCLQCTLSLAFEEGEGGSFSHFFLSFGTWHLCGSVMFHSFRRAQEAAERDLASPLSASQLPGAPSVLHVLPSQVGAGDSSMDVSARYAKKLIFVYVSQRAPHLHHELLLQQQQTSSPPRGAASPPSRSSAKSSLDVLCLTLELDVPQAHVEGLHTGHAKHTLSSPGPATERPLVTPAAASAVGHRQMLPPRYERLNRERRERQEQQRGRLQRWNIHSAYGEAAAATTALPSSNAEDGFYARQQRQVNALAQGEPSVIWTISETEWAQLHTSKLLAKPPQITSYRLIPLHECPMDIQRRAEGHDAESSFLVWACVYVNNTILLISDALVLRKTTALKEAAHEQHRASAPSSSPASRVLGSQHCAVNSAAVPVVNNANANSVDQSVAVATSPVHRSPPRQAAELVDLIASGKLSSASRLSETIVGDKIAEAKMPARRELAGLPAASDTLENKDITRRVAAWLKLSLFATLVTQPPHAAAAASPHAKQVSAANAQAVLADPWDAASGRASSPPQSSSLPTAMTQTLSAAAGYPSASLSRGCRQAATPGQWIAPVEGFTTDELPHLVAEELGRNIRKDPFCRQRVAAWEPSAHQAHTRRKEAEHHQQQLTEAVLADGAMEAAVVDTILATTSAPNLFFGSSLNGKKAASGGATGFRRVQGTPERAKFLSQGARPAFPLREMMEVDMPEHYSAPASSELLARSFQDRTYHHDSPGPHQQQSRQIMQSTAEIFGKAKGMLLEARSEIGALSVMAASLGKEVGRHQELLEMLQFEAMQRTGDNQRASEILGGLTERIARAARRMDYVDRQNAEIGASKQLRSQHAGVSHD
jgi:hypothetical protein